MLENLTLTNIKVKDESLRPIANCKKLKKLTLSNQFKTEEYIFLHAKLKNTICKYFAPFVKLSKPIDNKDVMIIGKRKPFLNSKKDEEKLIKYINSYNDLLKSYSN